MKHRRNIEIPQGEFTIKDIQEKYPTVPNITIRYHVNRERELGNVRKIRREIRPLGRPITVYARVVVQLNVGQTIVAPALLEAA